VSVRRRRKRNELLDDLEETRIDCRAIDITVGEVAVQGAIVLS
jgi:hypothetical protein